MTRHPFGLNHPSSIGRRRRFTRSPSRRTASSTPSTSPCCSERGAHASSGGAPSGDSGSVAVPHFQPISLAALRLRRPWVRLANTLLRGSRLVARDSLPILQSATRLSSPKSIRNPHFLKPSTPWPLLFLDSSNASRFTLRPELTRSVRGASTCITCPLIAGWVPGTERPCRFRSADFGGWLQEAGTEF